MQGNLSFSIVAGRLGLRSGDGARTSDPREARRAELLSLRERAGGLAALGDDELVSRHAPEAGLGRHRDAPMVAAESRPVELIEERVRLGGRAIALRRPPDAEALLDEEAFEREELLPYWAELWPSGLVLAREIARREVAGLDVLELGCGLGLPSLAAALCGARVLATDWSPDAVALLRENAARNAVELAVERMDWARPGDGIDHTWDLVLAADVLYERRNVEPLLALLERLDPPEALLAEPGRPASKEFLARAGELWRVESRRPEGGAVELHRLLRR